MPLMLLLLLLLEVDDARGNACLRSLTTSTGAQLLLNEPNSSPTLTHALMTLRRDSIANQPPCDCCLLYTSPSPRDRQKSRMPSSA